MTDFVKQDDWDDNAIPILRHVDRVMTYFCETEQKTPLGIDRDRTVQDEAGGPLRGETTTTTKRSFRGEGPSRRQ